MSSTTIVIIVVLLVLLGGGGWGYRTGAYSGNVLSGGIGLVALIVVLILLFGR